MLVRMKRDVLGVTVTALRSSRRPELSDKLLSVRNKWKSTDSPGLQSIHGNAYKGKTL